MYLFKSITSILLLLAGGFILSCTDISNDKGLENKTTTHKPDSLSQNPFSPVDKSPMDMSYYPPDYPLMKESGIDTEPLVARIIYSRPQLNGRIIFGDTTQPVKPIQYYGQNWRMGANEATEIEFFKDVTISGNKLSKGRYIIYCIPYPDKWTIVFNSNTFAWGRVINTNKDIFKTDIPVKVTGKKIEYLTMIFEKADSGANLLILWGNLKASLRVSF